MAGLETVHAVYEEQPEIFAVVEQTASDALTAYIENRNHLADDLEQGRLTPEQERAAFARLQADVLHS